MNLAVNQRLAVDVTRFEEVVDLRVIPQPCPIGISPADFSHSAELIERSHVVAHEWLAAPHPATGQAALFAPHRH